MSLVDVAIPLTIGILLVAVPQIFFRKQSWATDDDIARKKGQLRKIGCILIVVAAGYLALTLTQR